MRRLVTALSPTTPEHVEAIAEVHALAMECAALEPHKRYAFVAGIAQMSGWQRCWVTRHTDPDHPAFRPLMAMLDLLIERSLNAEGMIETRHGIFSKQDRLDHEAKIERNDGKEIIIWPVRYPWRSKPDPDRGTSGIRGEAIYRSVEQRCPTVGSFRAGAQNVEVKQREPEWWER